MTYFYFADSVQDPCELARLSAPAGATPDGSGFKSFWVDSVGEVWVYRSDSWAPKQSVVSDVYGTGDWEPVDPSEVGAVKQRIRDRFAVVG
jgi:hypothetical protein